MVAALPSIQLMQQLVLPSRSRSRSLLLLLFAYCYIRALVLPWISFYLSRIPSVLTVKEAEDGPERLIPRRHRLHRLIERWYSEALIQVNKVITKSLHKSDICWPLKHGSSESKVGWQK